jgi:NitT/TauT family transport system permease protein
MRELLKPNGKVSRRLMAAVVASQVVALVAVWACLPVSVFPGPSDVAVAWVGLVRDGMAAHLFSSLVTNVQAILISCAISLLVSYASVVPVARPLSAVAAQSRFFGLTGFVLLFTVLFGSGHGLKVSLLTFGMSVFFVTSMASVIADIPRSEYDHARTLRMGPWRTVWEVVVLGRADAALEILRQNAAIGWMMLTMVEGLSRSEGGLGVLLLDENKHFRLASVTALQVTILAIGMLQDRAILWIKRVACPYSEMTLERR